ncbi:MAG: hypothetical protein MK089_03300 [Phycisphaerales bacterium]|nr:hypothetical protein [Phycisphaerales bacterium]
MNSLVAAYRRCQRLQSKLWLRITLSILCLAACAGYFAPILNFSYQARADRMAIFESLLGDEAEQNQRIFRETGEIFIEGRIFKINTDLMPQIFNEEGQMTSPEFAVFMALRGDFEQIFTWAPRWLVTQPATTWVVAGLALSWLWLIIWIGLFVPFAITLLSSIGLYWLIGLMDLPELQLAVAGIGLLTFTFLLLIRALLVALSWPSQVFAVAHTVIKEASRTKLTLLFIIVILLMLPLLPLTLDPSAQLRFQIQTFMRGSLDYTFVLAGCMTLLLACGTVAFEIRDRHIWHVMSKPVGHFQYLLGKWLGIVLLNGSLLVVAGASVFLYIQYLRTTNVETGVAADEDRMIVTDQVLVARMSSSPVLEVPTETSLSLEVDRIVEADSAFSTFREKGMLPQVRARIRKDLLAQYEMQQRTIPPSRKGQPGSQTFRFEGLEEAARTSSPITLRYQFIIRQADEHERYVAGFIFNEKENPDSILLQEYIPTVPQVMKVPPTYIRPDGTLDVTILNYFEPPPGRYFGQMFFDKGALEVLYRVGGFESNFFRAILILLIKLGVLAALGVFFSTFLNFPVACLSAFTLFIAGQMAPFLADSLTLYFPERVEALDWSNIGQVMKWGFETAIRGLAQGMVYVLGAFGEYHPIADLVEGRYVSWKTVFGSFLRLELIWAGSSLVLGWLVLRGRQLAIYSGGQG